MLSQFPVDVNLLATDLDLTKAFYPASWGWRS
jgi:hypothetical protein